MDPSRNSFAKLSGSNNYQVWAIKMKSYLIAQDLWSVVELSSKSSVTDIKSLNSKAMSLIILSCEDHIIRLLDPDELAANAWKKLEKQYGLVGFSARHLAFQSLVSTDISSCSSIDLFIDQFRSNVNTLSQITTSTLPQWLLLSIFINNVSSQYEPWSQSIMQQVRMKTIPEDSRSFLEEVIASLLDEARRLGGNNNNENSNTAMTARKPVKQKPICRYCGKIHKSENCWQEFPEKKPSARLTTTSQNQNTSMSSETSKIVNNHTPYNIAFLSQTQRQKCDTWILDSGATQHMCNDKSQFTALENYATTITTANNTQMNACGRGEVHLMTRNGTTFRLLNVLYVPQLATNLLSVCYATRNPDMRFNIINGKCEITYKNQILAIANQRDSLLVLETIRPSAHTASSIDALTWHKRLGHVNEDYMSKGAIGSLVGPMKKFTCETCLKNKSTRHISRTAAVKSTRILEKIHSDIAGPITPTSLGGNKYVITFTDDYSRFSWVFPCVEKSRCLDIFRVFKTAVEIEFNQKIAIFHCDNGGEYSSNEWKKFSQQQGFKMTYTVPYTPEQNGVAERLNRTLFNTTRCLLHDSTNLDKHLWAELVRTACYVKNRLPTSANEDFKSPYEMAFNRSPSLQHLRIIGSTCYNHQTGKITGKLDERSKVCYLVGYDSENIYRVYDPANRRVIRSRDIVIHESVHANQNQIPSITPSANCNEMEVDLSTQNLDHSSRTRSTATEINADVHQSPSLNQYHTATSFPDQDTEISDDTSLDELADPRYYRAPELPKVFLSRCLVAANSANEFIPDTLEQAMKCKKSQQWAISMRDEIRSIVQNTTWKLVPVPEDGSKVIQGRWVYRTKTDALGKIVKYKSRWVVRGFQQEEGSNYSDTFASVVKPMSYKILFSIAATQNLEIEQMDVKTAFLNSPINEDVYVEQPHGFEITNQKDEQNLRNEIFSANASKPNKSNAFPRERRSKSTMVCKLEKALYGLKQAPRAWYQTLSEFMATMSFTPLRSDYAVFMNPKRTIFIAVYVDDMLIFGKSKTDIGSLKRCLQLRFQMTDMGQAHMYLGMQITRDPNTNNIKLDQQKYIQVVLERFNMTDCNPVSTPMETGLKLGHRSDSASPDEINQYQKLIGCLEYAANATRPDITYSVHRLAQFSSNPDPNHYKAAKRILRYLKGTIDFCLVFHGGKTTQFELIGFTDADWAGCTIDRKSIGGYCFYINNNLISHRSRKQKTVALSTAESETHAAIEATKEAIWLRNILQELGYKQNLATTIFCDNQAAIALSRNPEFHSRSKHVDMQYQFLRQHVQLCTINLSFIRSEKMAADGLTKPLSRPKHEKFCKFLQGQLKENDI